MGQVNTFKTPVTSIINGDTYQNHLVEQRDFLSCVRVLSRLFQLLLSADWLCYGSVLSASGAGKTAFTRRSSHRGGMGMHCREGERKWDAGMQDEWRGHWQYKKDLDK